MLFDTVFIIISFILIKGQNIIVDGIYVGCYSNSSDRGIELYSTHPSSESSKEHNSPAKCHAFCYTKGYRYFALNKDLCTCGDDLPLEGVTKILNDLNPKECGSKCIGDENEYCGGAPKQMFSLHATGIPNIPEDGRFVGCFKNINSNIKPDLAVSLTFSNSNQRCLNICDGKGFKFAGVLMGTKCLCMNQSPSLSSLQNNFFCEKSDCPGEITRKCGSKVGVKVYKTRHSDKNQSPKSILLGCFKYQSDYRDLHEINTIQYDMTPSSCVEYCKIRGFAYSSMRGRRECYCSHLFPSDNEKVAIGDCSESCNGDPNEFCGGRNARRWYNNNGTSSTQSYVEYNYVGCYEDGVGDGTLIKINKIVIDNLSPTLCHRHCLTSATKYFGMTLEPRTCFCIDVPPPHDLLHTNTETINECPGKYKAIIFRTGLVEFDDISESFKGCYKIDGTVLREQVFSFMKTLTPNRCLMLCNMSGFAYAAVNEGWDCQCGDNFPNKFPVESEDKCNIKCPGDPTETCGGPNSYAKVYRISVISAPEQPQTLTRTDGPTFSENFNTIDTSVWSYTIKMAHEPDYEFVNYHKSDKVVYVKQGKLFISPKIAQSESYVNGAQSLKNCTGQLGGPECTRKASNYYILPPVFSGQLTTKNKFSFTYGKVEVRAKLPIGDWMVPEIWLSPKMNAYGHYYQSGQIRIAMSRGNTKYECSGEDYGHKRLEMGIYLGPELHEKNKVYLFHKITPEGWSNDFHNYTVIWNPDKISFQVDSENLGTIQPTTDQTIRDIVGLSKEYEYIYSGSTSKLAPFDKEFYITLGVSVGGLNDFPDNCVTNPAKPWSNSSPKAMLNFWQKRDDWNATWKDENSALQVESVNVWSL